MTTVIVLVTINFIRQQNKYEENPMKKSILIALLTFLSFSLDANLKAGVLGDSVYNERSDCFINHTGDTVDYSSCKRHTDSL